jgi:uncharacterized protein
MLAMAKRLTRRQFLVTGVLGALAAPPAGLGYAYYVEPYWVSYRRANMPMAHLPQSFDGFRIVHLTDLHLGDTPADFLKRVMNRINRQGADLVLITGDLITTGRGRISEVVDVLKTLKAPVAVSLGNHDYGLCVLDDNRVVGSAERHLTGALREAGCMVLRNEVHTIRHDDGELHIAGMEDPLSGQFKPRRVIEHLDIGRSALLVMSHNPDTAEPLAKLGVPWVLSGHTHGGQVRLPFIGPLAYLPVRNQQFDQGLFRIGNTRLYVNRGLGYLYAMRFWCRPEVVTFVLRRA